MLIRDCVNYAKLDGHNVGGIIGARQGTGKMESPSRITGCENYGEIAAHSYGGGIIGFRNVGENGSNSVYVITDCSNFGKLTYRDYKAKEDGTRANTVSSLGGIVGYYNLKTANAIIVGCSNYGEIETAGKVYVGSMIGSVDLGKLNGGKLTLSNCMNAGDFSCQTADVMTTEDGACGRIYGQSDNELIKNTVFFHGIVNAGKVYNNTVQA